MKSYGAVFPSGVQAVQYTVKVLLTYESMRETFTCDHSKESY